MKYTTNGIGTVNDINQSKNTHTNFQKYILFSNLFDRVEQNLNPRESLYTKQPKYRIF